MYHICKRKQVNLIYSTNDEKKHQLTLQWEILHRLASPARKLGFPRLSNKRKLNTPNLIVMNDKDFKALAKLANITWQTLLFVSESLAMNKKVTPNLLKKETIAMLASFARP